MMENQLAKIKANIIYWLEVGILFVFLGSSVLPGCFLLLMQFFAIIYGDSTGGGAGLPFLLVLLPICFALVVIGGIALLYSIVMTWYWGFTRYIHQRILYCICTICLLLPIGGGLAYLYVNAGGNMAVTHQLGCLTPSQVSNQYTPVDLLQSYKQCLKENKDEEALFLKKLIQAYLEFDKTRVNPDLLKFGSSTYEKYAQIQALLTTKEKEISFSHEQICKEVDRVGMPNYYPRYLVSENKLKRDFTAQAAWKKIQHEFLNCSVPFTGDMKITHNIGCLKADQITNKYTPVDLLTGSAQCIRENRFEDAAFMQNFSGTYAYFDKSRVADKVDAKQAGKALSILGQQADEQRGPKIREDYGRWYRNWNSSSNSMWATICANIERIGMPNYMPLYMSTNGLISNFDAKTVWREAIPSDCPSSLPQNLLRW